MWKKKGFRIAVSLVITGLALWLSFRRIDFGVFKQALSRVNYFWVLLALGNTLISVFMLGFRWAVLLRPKAKVGLGSLFHYNIISQYANIVFPARFGEVVRAYLVSKKKQVPAGFAMGTVMIEKMLDLFVFVGFWILIPAVFALELQFKGYQLALIVCLMLLGLLIFLILKPDVLLKLLRRFSRLLPARFQPKVNEFLESGTESFRLLKSAKITAWLIFLSLLFVGGQALTNFLLFQAFGLKLSFWAAIVVLLGIQVGNIPPSIPGKIGLFEFAVIVVLGVFGVPKDEALSYGILLHIVAFLPKIILGQIYVIRGDKIKIAKI